jgi:pimeloyl-ACP methyl ester carboxylesterase
MRHVHTPLLVLHGNADTLIPIDQGRRVERESGSATKQFVEIPNAMHSDIWYGDRPAGGAIVAFMEALAK